MSRVHFLCLEVTEEKADLSPTHVPGTAEGVGNQTAQVRRRRSCLSGTQSRERGTRISTEKDKETILRESERNTHYCQEEELEKRTTLSKAGSALSLGPDQLALTGSLRYTFSVRS